MWIFTFTVLLLALLGTGAHAQQADSLWSVVWHSPANDMVRVNKFQAGYDTCKPCMDMAEKTGEFKLFRRMRMEGFWKFHAFALYIDDYHGLIFDEQSKIVLVTVDKDGTERRYVSNQITFAVGGLPMPQTSELINTERPVYVKPINSFNGPTSRDLEWLRLKSEGEYAAFYVVGYARFDDEPDLGKNVQLDVENVTLYRIER